mmetsp:Transcript_11209/g.17001  ORF Transcript_11209/g.17001 Transcript_11209/m.17001 type:complete len:105 (-) Transcript_11209:594-908(-)|eukprot:CAMPEP_0170511844 /NCGR_PEP_ID=MMETSP0208-20121228/66522_1 /TAXON_ID=197538 /ORGANISM="Strombidium inclinatum, Strain S3" /LENGTH=104 /DNA_ID=CAMNT_0010795415 /DNA_START=2889 /DNA_END=3203 /DNA_ORIENTATION=-
MEGATIKVDLAATELNEFQKQEVKKYKEMGSPFITDLKEIEAQQDISLLTNSYSNMEITAILEALPQQSTSSLKGCLTRGQNFFGFIQDQDCSMLLNLILESGW